MSVIATEGTRIGDVVKYETGGLNYYSRDEVVAGEALAVGDIIAAGGTKIADAIDVVGVVVIAAASGAPAVYLARESIVGSTAINYNGQAVVTVDAVLKGLGILVRSQQPAASFS